MRFKEEFMALFDFFKKRDSIQDYLDSFFKNMVIIDVIAWWDIPVMNIDGIERRPNADIFFQKFSRINHRIDSFISGRDDIFWIFETFFVLELYASNDEEKQFVVIELQNPEQGYKDKDRNELKNRLDAMESSIRILGLIQQLDIPTMEITVFKEAWDFFIRNQKHHIELLTKKYS